MIDIKFVLPLVFIIFVLIFWPLLIKGKNNLDFKKLLHSKDGQTHVVTFRYHCPLTFSWRKYDEKRTAWIDEKITYMQTCSYEILGMSVAYNYFSGYTEIFILYK